MKFAEHLLAHITPEWRKQYISYEEMKLMLYNAVEEAPSAESVEPEVLTRHFAHFDDHFFQYCDAELKKVNTFYSEKLAEATRKFAALLSELKNSSIVDGKNNKSVIKPYSDKSVAPVRKVQELKLAFSEFYLSLILLQNYQTLNFTGFRKILKKHDKLLAVDSGVRWRQENVETSHIYTNKDIDRLITETEATVTQDLEGGDRQKAMKRLRVPPLGEQQSPWITFKVGLFSGSFIVLCLAVILSVIFHDNGMNNVKAAYRLYRGPLLIIVFIFLMGVNVYGWRSSGVNHVLIFELDPRNHLSEQHLMELAAILGVVWTLSVLSFLYSASLSIHPFVNPLALSLIMALFLINPIQTFHYEARKWALNVLFRIIAAPFFHVGFADFWLADQLNSLVGACLDYHFLIFFYIQNGDWFLVEANNETQIGINEKSQVVWISKAIVSCLPAWFRFAQCLRRYRDSKEAFPHLVNAGKYSTTFLVVVFSTLRFLNPVEDDEEEYENPYLYLWIIASFVSSCYAYTWDIKMDWGLFDSSADENKFLREEIVYSSTWFYYFAIIEDLILRFSWLILFLLTEVFSVASNDLVSSLTMPLEVFRRFIWNFFRLENEHLNNCGKFRAVRDISVAPIDSSDQILIIRMMDEENGVLNRKKKKPTKKAKEERLLLIENMSHKLEACSSEKDTKT